MTTPEWTTLYPAGQDSLPVQQPTLVNDVDWFRVSHIHTMRDKLDAVANRLGDDTNAPASSVRARVKAIEDLDAPRERVHFDDAELTETGTSYATKKLQRLFVDATAPPEFWRIAFSVWAEGGASVSCRVEVGVDVYEITGVTGGTEEFKFGTISNTNPTGAPITIAFKLKVETAGTAHIKYTEVNSIREWV